MLAIVVLVMGLMGSDADVEPLCETDAECCEIAPELDPELCGGEA